MIKYSENNAKKIKRETRGEKKTRQINYEINILSKNKF